MWEGVAQVVHEPFPAGVAFGYDEDDHPLAVGGVADDEVAEASGVVADVVEGEVVGDGVVAGGQPYTVAECGLEGAVLDVEHFVEEGGDVEAEGAGLGRGVGCGRQVVPCPRGEGELELVAILVDVFGTADGLHAGAVEVSQPLEVVPHLLLLGGQLVGVVEGLPAAATAGAEMGTLGRHPPVGELVDGHGLAFGIAFLLLEDFDVGHVAGDDVGDEDHHAVDAGNGFAFGADVGDGDVLEYGLLFFLLHGLGGGVCCGTDGLHCCGCPPSGGGGRWSARLRSGCKKKKY